MVRKYGVLYIVTLGHGRDFGVYPDWRDLIYEEAHKCYMEDSTGESWEPGEAGPQTEER